MMEAVTVTREPLDCLLLTTAIAIGLAAGVASAEEVDEQAGVATQPDAATAWAVLKAPAKRAAWVWDFAATDAGLPAGPGPATASQRAANKLANKTWDGEPTGARVRMNYRGSRDLLLDFCHNKSIRELYIYGSAYEWSRDTLEAGRIPDADEWAAFNAAAAARGVEVWYMFYLWDDTDDPRMADDLDAIAVIAKAVHAFNEAHPEGPFRGIHCDQEPNEPPSYPALLDNTQRAADWTAANAPTLMLSQALRPKWCAQRVSWRGVDKLMNEHMIDVLDHGVLMAYSNSLDSVNRWTDIVADYAAAQDEKVAVGFEVGNLTGAWPGSEQETWYEEIQAEPADSRFKANPDDDVVTFEDAILLTETRYGTHPAYDRLAIHSLEAYFQHWFGHASRDYLLSQPGGRYSSSDRGGDNEALTNDARPLYIKP